MQLGGLLSMMIAQAKTDDIGQQKAGVMLNIGDTAPDFELPNQNGKMVKLSDFRGKKVVIFSFPKANSMGCTMQACAFRDEAPTLNDSNAVVLGLSPDPQTAMKKFKERQNLAYDLLSDTDHSVLEAWGAWGPSVLGVIKLPLAKRSYWVLDENGVVIDMKIDAGPKESAEKAVAALRSASAATGD